MNDRMRHYLDDDWEPTEQPDQRVRSERRPDKPIAKERRQQGKEWGRAHAKWHRERKKAGLAGNKP